MSTIPAFTPAAITPTAGTHRHACPCSPDGYCELIDRDAAETYRAWAGKRRAALVGRWAA